MQGATVAATAATVSTTVLHLVVVLLVLLRAPVAVCGGMDQRGKSACLCSCRGAYS